MSADGDNWLLINASPDLPQQLRQSKALRPRAATRGSPIKAVLLTGAEIDQVAGLLSLREREPFEVHVIAMDAFTLDGVKRLEAMGVTDAIVGFRNAYEKDTQTIAQKTEALSRFAEAVIAKL